MLKKRFLLTIPVVIFLSGCTSTREFAFESVSKGYDPTHTSEFVHSKDIVSGTAKAGSFPVPVDVDLRKPAVDEALKGVPGAIGLANGKFTFSSFWLIIGSYSCKAEGTPVIDPYLAKSEGSKLTVKGENK